MKPLMIRLAFGLAIFVLLLGVSNSSANVSINSAAAQNVLALKSYFKTNPYNEILISPPGTDSESSDDYVVNPFVVPQMGWHTGGKPAQSPTKVAAQGINFEITGNIKDAIKCANWLIANSQLKNGALFFPFNFDYAPEYPISLHAPWYSGLTQGLALTLFSYLYSDTKQEQYKNWANEVYQSYTLPIQNGGFVRYESQGPFIEEYPTSIPTRVLNGTCVSMLAVHDYAMIIHNTQALHFFNDLVNRLSILLPEYNYTNPKYPFLLSKYSLTPFRDQILGRFIGSSHAVIRNLSLVGEKQGQEKVLESVDVGQPNDDNVMNPLYVWDDPKAMNWGAPITNTGGRDVNGNLGSYNHSPFEFAFMSSFASYEELILRIQYQGQNSSDEKVELYDNGQYSLLGEIPPSQQLNTVQFKIPLGMINDFLKSSQSNSPFDPRYMDDQQILIKLVADVTGSREFAYYANLWKDSTAIVPGEQLNEAPPDMLGPSIHLDFQSNHSHRDSLGTANPSVIKYGNIFIMYYSETGENSRSNIFVATSLDGQHWTSIGYALKNTASTYDYTTPCVIKSTSDPNTLLMYYGVKDRTTGNSTIHIALSSDGVNWKDNGEIDVGQGTHPWVISDKEGNLNLYYLKKNGDGSNVEMSTSSNGIKWSIPRTILSTNNAWDKISSINGFLYHGKEILLLDNLSPSRNNIEMYVEDEGKIVSCNINPVNVDTRSEGKWDSVRIGYDIVPVANNLYVYFTGFESIGVNESMGGSIGMAQLNQSILNEYFDTRNLSSGRLSPYNGVKSVRSSK